MPSLSSQCGRIDPSLRLLRRTIGREASAFSYVTYDVPPCLDFTSMVQRIIDDMEPSDFSTYISFLTKISIGIICYPDFILSNNNIKNRIRYSPKEKTAALQIVIDYADFIHASQTKKLYLIANGIRQEMLELKVRLQKYGKDIDDLINFTNITLQKYLYQEANG